MDSERSGNFISKYVLTGISVNHISSSNTGNPLNKLHNYIPKTSKPPNTYIALNERLARLSLTIQHYTKDWQSSYCSSTDAKAIEKVFDELTRSSSESDSSESCSSLEESTPKNKESLRFIQAKLSDLYRELGRERLKEKNLL